MDHEGVEMTKQEIVKDLKIATNGSSWISQNKLRKWYGHRFATMQELVEGLDYARVGKSKEYFVGDVADRIMARRERA